MLRSILISFSKASWAKKIVTHWKFARRVVRRFVAGETLDEAIEAVRVLNQAGMVATIDHLGENTCSREESQSATRDVLKILEAIETHNLRSNVSVKLSQIGLVIDEELCRENLRTLLEKAQQTRSYIRIDMEDSTLTTATIDTYLWARNAGYENVGIVLQSYLYRTAKDIENLMNFNTRVRLCKGAYKEPASVAFPEKAKVDENFDRLVDQLFDASQKWGYPPISADGRVPSIPGIATHDPARIDYAINEAEKRGFDKACYEFQMLYGIRRDLQDKLIAEGCTVRIYVPYGTHWYPYFMRRLAERPSNLWFFVSNFFHK